MKNFNRFLIIFILALTPFLQSCELAGDIFETGIWIGVSLVLVVIFVVLWLFGKAKR
jgi:hypothetical protein